MNWSSWDREVENDVGIIDLASDAPLRIAPFFVRRRAVNAGLRVMYTGRGTTSSDCSRPGTSLNARTLSVSRLVDSGRIIQYDSPLFCDQDRGGIVLDTAGRVLIGSASVQVWTLSHGTVAKSAHVPSYRDWILQGVTDPGDGGGGGGGNPPGCPAGRECCWDNPDGTCGFCRPTDGVCP
jgi:hypothetical protein